MLIVVALVLAGTSQLLNLMDPIIFGNIIDDYALNPNYIPENALVAGVIFWLGVAEANPVRGIRQKISYFVRKKFEKFRR